MYCASADLYETAVNNLCEYFSYQFAYDQQALATNAVLFVCFFLPMQVYRLTFTTSTSMKEDEK